MLQKVVVATLVDDTSAEMKKTISIEISEDALDKITLTDLTKEQIENLLFADYLKLYLPYTRI